jgi:hypothetical protein
MTTVPEVAWLAGLLEGEGTFAYRNCGPRISVAMTDRDVIERAEKLLKSAWDTGRESRIYELPVKDRMTKPGYVSVVTHTRAAAWMMTILPFMGARRAEKIRSVLGQWRESKAYVKGRKPSCHPDRAHEGEGLCKSCYNGKHYPKSLYRDGGKA